jgi:DNA polymerase-3 subunit gamma/tau
VVEPETAERDDATSDMFGAPAEASPAPAYTVIARKYRPRTFDDLIGQEAMVRTLTNAFASGRIAHAFMLTGVRGVGKTTTARLLARALNYESEAVRQPSLADLAVEGRHCRPILEGRHLDVLELDAASRSKVDEMRELLDGVRYAPAQARYKVYIIDEVHMLSPAAFNALLKTLEEPPPHAKFILATTEIRKVPVTILSRRRKASASRATPWPSSPAPPKVRCATPSPCSTRRWPRQNQASPWTPPRCATCWAWPTEPRPSSYSKRRCAAKPDRPSRLIAPCTPMAPTRSR